MGCKAFPASDGVKLDQALSYLLGLLLYDFCFTWEKCRFYMYNINC